MVKALAFMPMRRLALPFVIALFSDLNPSIGPTARVKVCPVCMRLSFSLFRSNKEFHDNSMPPLHAQSQPGG